MTNEGQLVYF